MVLYDTEENEMIDPKLLFITNNSGSSADLPKILCCCHPDDADHLKSVCDDLFAAEEAGYSRCILSTRREY